MTGGVSHGAEGPSSQGTSHGMGGTDDKFPMSDGSKTITF